MVIIFFLNGLLSRKTKELQSSSMATLLLFFIHFLHEVLHGILFSEIAEALVQNPISKLSIPVCRHILFLIDYTLIHSTFLASKASGRVSFESILSIAFGGTASSRDLFLV